jgi:RNA polymerase sigma-70 factor (ECF subfamily)
MSRDLHSPDDVGLGESFSEVLLAARTGAEWAWTILYGEFAPSVLGYLRARRAPEAEDLLGEVFLQLVRDLSGFEGDERDFRAWAFTVAHHRLLDDQRSRRRRPVEPAPDAVIERRAALGDVEEEALEQLGAQEVRRIIGGLSADQQSVLLLRILGGLTVAEVARTLGKRPGAIKALQRRGLAAIERDLSRRGVTL